MNIIRSLVALILAAGSTLVQVESIDFTRAKERLLRSRSLQTPDGETPATETVCDHLKGQRGPAFGLCNAYCEGQDCPHEEYEGCEAVEAAWNKLVGEPLPCAPTTAPTMSPAKNPTESPTESPTKNPTESPTKNPTESPTKNPTAGPVDVCEFACCKGGGGGCSDVQVEGCGGDCFSCYLEAQTSCSDLNNRPAPYFDIGPGRESYSCQSLADDNVGSCGECSYACCDSDTLCVDIERDFCKGDCSFSSYCYNAADGICNFGFGGVFKGEGTTCGTVTCPTCDRARLLRDAGYNPTPEEAIQVAEETGGNLDAGYVLGTNLLTPIECALLISHTDQSDGIKYRGNDDDKVIMFRKTSPLEDIIGIERTKELYQYFKDNTDDAPITQVWFRKMSGTDTFMGLHVDTMPHQLKIALNDDFAEGDTLVVDRDGAKRFHLETGAGYLHDDGLVHGHMPFTGAKYMLYLVSDPKPRIDLAQPVLAL